MSCAFSKYFLIICLCRENVSNCFNLLPQDKLATLWFVCLVVLAPLSVSPDGCCQSVTSFELHNTGVVLQMLYVTSSLFQAIYDQSSLILKLTAAYWLSSSWRYSDRSLKVTAADDDTDIFFLLYFVDFTFMHWVLSLRPCSRCSKLVLLSFVCMSLHSSPLKHIFHLSLQLASLKPDRVFSAFNACYRTSWFRIVG